MESLQVPNHTATSLDSQNHWYYFLIKRNNSPAMGKFFGLAKLREIFLKALIHFRERESTFDYFIANTKTPQ